MVGLTCAVLCCTELVPFAMQYVELNFLMEVN